MVKVEILSGLPTPTMTYFVTVFSILTVMIIAAIILMTMMVAMAMTMTIVVRMRTKTKKSQQDPEDPEILDQSLVIIDSEDFVPVFKEDSQ